MLQLTSKEKRILSLQVTSEQVHDGKVLPKLVDDITIKQNKEIDMTIADGAYDSNNNFQFLSFKGIKPAIKVRKNSRCRKTNHYLRNKTVKMQKNNLQEWKDSVSYGQAMDCRNCLLLYQENVWRICYCYQVREHDKRNGTESIVV